MQQIAAFDIPERCIGVLCWFADRLAAWAEHEHPELSELQLVVAGPALRRLAGPGGAGWQEIVVNGFRTTGPPGPVSPGSPWVQSPRVCEPLETVMAFGFRPAGSATRVRVRCEKRPAAVRVLLRRFVREEIERQRRVSTRTVSRILQAGDNKWQK